jgi:hypothetical protein
MTTGSMATNILTAATRPRAGKTSVKQKSGSASSKEYDHKIPFEKGIPFETKAYACIHVFEGIRPALFVTREDGDWAILCGGMHPEDPDY